MEMNFAFLEKKQEYELFSGACIDAERILESSPVMSAVASRKALELCVKWIYSIDSALEPIGNREHSFFHYIDQSIQSHCHNTEQNNRHEKPIHLKYLTGIDDQISKSAFGSEKFSDNDSHKTKSDIDFHIAYDCRNRGRQYNFCKRMPAVSVQCIYQFDLFLIDIDKGGIQIQDTSEDGDGHSGNNNCF